MTGTYADDRFATPDGVDIYKTPADLNDTERARYEDILRHHENPNPDTLAYACLCCGSIGECESQEARDTFVDNFYFACCGITVYLHSVQSDPPTYSRTDFDPFDGFPYPK